MDREDYLSSGANIKAIASVVTQKHVSKFQDYEKIYCFCYQQRS